MRKREDGRRLGLRRERLRRLTEGEQAAVAGGWEAWGEGLTDGQFHTNGRVWSKTCVWG